jgi:hypothetical protein
MKVYYVELKEIREEFIYKTLVGLCKSHSLGVSKGTLDRWDFGRPYENGVCRIRKMEVL